MIPADLADDIAIMGERLIAVDPALAAVTIAALNEKADAALGNRQVTLRLGQAHGKARDVERLTKLIAGRHAVTVEALASKLDKPHLLHARRHLAHALRHRLHLSYEDIGQAMRCKHTTAMRRAKEWARYLESVK